MSDAAGLQDGSPQAQGSSDGQAAGPARSQHRVRRSCSEERPLLVTFVAISCLAMLINLVKKIGSLNHLSLQICNQKKILLSLAQSSRLN